MMLRKFFVSSLLFLSISMLCWSTLTFAHDAFYPHHREDFKSMTRRRELRGTVILSTAVFLSVLGTVVYIALRKSKETDEIDHDEAKTIQERLGYAANSGAAAARHVLNTGGNVAKAAEAALTAYAEASGVTWQSRSYGQRRPESLPYQIRCKIGSDVVTLSINAEVVRLKAEHNFSKSGVGTQETPKSVNVVLKITDRDEEQGLV